MKQRMTNYVFVRELNLDNNSSSPV